MADDYRPQFTEGWIAYAGEPCPYLLTSNHADAWILGRFALKAGLEIPAKAKDLVKSRGYTWKLFGTAYRVEGETVERIG
jgi:hypothetical protein